VAARGERNGHRSGIGERGYPSNVSGYECVRGPSLEDQIPETHLLRLIDKHVSFEFVRERLMESYSETGRPSIDPELLLGILLNGYLDGITSEPKLVAGLRMHLAWRFVFDLLG